MKERVSPQRLELLLDNHDPQIRSQPDHEACCWCEVILDLIDCRADRDALAAQVEKAEGASLLAIEGAKDLSVSMAALLDERKALKEEVETLRGELRDLRAAIERVVEERDSALTTVRIQQDIITGKLVGGNVARPEPDPTPGGKE